MGKISEEVSKLYYNDNSFSSAYDKMNKELDKLTSCEVDMDILFDEYESLEEQKVMKLDRVRYYDKSSGDEGHYIRLLYQDDDGNFLVQCTQKIFDIESMGVMIGLDFIGQIQQLAYIGYKLVQSKTWEEKEVEELFIA